MRERNRNFVFQSLLQLIDGKDLNKEEADAPTQWIFSHKLLNLYDLAMIKEHVGDYVSVNEV